jgi:hypothetical protein
MSRFLFYASFVNYSKRIRKKKSKRKKRKNLPIRKKEPKSLYQNGVALENEKASPVFRLLRSGTVQCTGTDRKPERLFRSRIPARSRNNFEDLKEQNEINIHFTFKKCNKFFHFFSHCSILCSPTYAANNAALDTSAR